MDNTPQTPNQTEREMTTGAVPPAPRPAWQGKSYYQDDPRRKSPALAALLSLLPGLGQVYIGYYQHGFVNIIVIAGLIALLASDVGTGLTILAAFFMVFFWMYNLIDAARRASLYNQMLDGLGPTQFPEDVRWPSARGSLVGGVVLIGFGLLLLAHTRFNYSLDWLEEWWPFALVLAGAYLIYSWTVERRRKTARPTA
jgi:hypothetical protein